MTEKESTINKYFWSDFSKIYKKPSLIDDHLIKNSNLIEATLVKNFTELGLNQNYSIYANGGFGRKEMFPSSDIDISINEENAFTLACEFGHLEVAKWLLLIKPDIDISVEKELKNRM